jgi:hypothetical protein
MCTYIEGAYEKYRKWNDKVDMRQSERDRQINRSTDRDEETSKEIEGGGKTGIEA